MNTKLLYIIAGANGSGKSTLAKILLYEKKLEFLNADNIAKKISPNAIDTVPITAGKEYFKILKTFFEREISFAIETTLSGQNTAKIIKKAKEKKYKIILLYAFLPNCTSCIERVRKRVVNGGHNVPENDIIRRYYKSIVKFWNTYKNEVDEWNLFYNGLEYNPIIVSYGQKKQCEIVDKALQQKFLILLEIAKKEVNLNDK